MKNVLWMPVDLPKFPIKDFSLQTKNSWLFWDFIKLTENFGPYGKSQLREEIKKDFPDLVEWINLFPFSDIVNVKLNIQNHIVPAHIDFTDPDGNRDLYDNNAANDPCGYRVLISGQRKQKLFVQKGKKKVYVDLPETTDVYVLGQTTCLHGVDEDINRTTMYLHFYIDQHKHRQILERSWKVYKDYAVLDA